MYVLCGSPYYHSTTMRTFPMILLYSEDEPEETFPASRMISSQILGYNGGKVNSKERVKVLFPVHVSLCFTPPIIEHINSWQTELSQCHNGVMELWIHTLPKFTTVTKAH